jgi:hypothetical protein
MEDIVLGGISKWKASQVVGQTQSVAALTPIESPSLFPTPPVIMDMPLPNGGASTTQNRFQNFKVTTLRWKGGAVVRHLRFAIGSPLRRALVLWGEIASARWHRESSEYHGLGKMTLRIMAAELRAGGRGGIGGAQAQHTLRMRDRCRQYDN